MDNSNNIYLNEHYATGFRKVSRICRACMAAKQKMLNINHFKGSYKDLTGINISPSDGLPQWLCIECAGLLKKCIKFRHLLMQSHNALSQCVLKTVPLEKRNCEEDRTRIRISTSPLNEIDIPVITKVECVKVKEETVDFDNEDNLTAEDFCEGNRQIDVKTSTKEICSNISNDGKHIDHVKLEKQINDTDANNYDMIVTAEIENMEIKEETVYPDYQENITREEFCEETVVSCESSTCDPMESDTSEICSAVINHEDQTDSGQMSDRESYVDIEAAPHLPLAKESSSHEQSSGPDPTKSENITQKKDSGNATSRVVKKYGSAKAKIKETKIKTKKITVIRKSDTQNAILANGEQIEVQNNVVVVLLKNKNNKDTNVKSTIVTDGGVVNHSSSNVKPYRFDESKNCLNNISFFPACVSENSIERSFKCDSCEKCFTTRYYSSLHARIHAGGGPYKCDLCYKCYVFKGSLEQHIRKHRVRMPNMRYAFCSRP